MKSQKYKSKTRRAKQSAQHAQVVVKKADKFVGDMTEGLRKKEKSNLILGPVKILGNVATGNIAGAVISAVSTAYRAVTTDKKIRAGEAVTEELEGYLEEAVRMSDSDVSGDERDEKEEEIRNLQNRETLAELELYNPLELGKKVAAIQELLSAETQIALIAQTYDVNEKIMLEFINTNNLKLSSSAIETLHQLYMEALRTNDVEKAKWYLGLKNVEGVVTRLQIPEKLYGRETETKEILSEFMEVQEEGTKLILVSGYSGVGKTSVIHEAREEMKKMAGTKSYFAVGKFDQFQRVIPYTGIGEAFNAFIDTVLEEKEVLEATRTRLLEALGPNGQIIIDVVPKLEALIGAQPPVKKLEGPEGQTRFNLVFQNFLEALISEEQLLIVFLDDLQWIDDASLKLLELLITTRSAKGFMIIGAYRDNEVDEHHPLMTTLTNLRKQEVQITELELKPLQKEHVTQLVAECLASPPERVVPLSDLIYQKTEGNPFFVMQFFTMLNEETFLYFDSTKSQWCWDLAKIEAQDVTSNVTDLLCRKMLQLSPDVQEVLKWASCIGHYFELWLLTEASQNDRNLVIGYLEEAVQEKLIIHSEVENAYRFIHDQVQRSAYSLLSEEERPIYHLTLGRLLLQKTSEQEQDQKIFDIVDQLNAGWLHMTDLQEKKLLSQLNLKAAQRAKAAAAFNAGLKYSSIGIEHYPGEVWEADYEIAFELHKLRCACEYVSGDIQQAYQYTAVLLEQAQTPLEQSDIRYMQCNYLGNIGECGLEEIMQQVLAGLEVLGISFSYPPSPFSMIWEIIQLEWNLCGRTVSSLLDLPTLEDPIKIASLNHFETIVDMGGALGNQEMLTIGLFKILNTCLRYGNTKMSSIAFIGYGMFLIIVQKDFQAGQSFSELSLKLAYRSNNDKIIGETLNLYAGYIVHALRPLRESIPLFKEAGTRCLNAGVQLATLGMIYVRLFYYDHERNVTEHCEEVQSLILFMNKKIKDYFWTQAAHVFAGYFLNLGGLTHSKFSLSFEDFVEENAVMIFKEKKLNVLICMHQVLKAMLYYLYEEYTLAFESAHKSESEIDNLFGDYLISQHCINYFLAASALCCKKNSQRKRYEGVMLKQEKKMKVWAAHCFENFGHHYLLMLAEIAAISGGVQSVEDEIMVGYARITNKQFVPTVGCLSICQVSKFDASTLYNMAIESSRLNGFLQYEACCNERTAQYYLGINNSFVAAVYLKEAYRCYVQWGALAKVMDLQERYPQLLERAHLLDATQLLTMRGHFWHPTKSKKSKVKEIETTEYPKEYSMDVKP